MNSPIESLKIVLLGEAGVGKTSIISQFVEQTFQEDIQSSAGGTFSSKTCVYGNNQILKLEIWDTAGQERYRALTKMFYKDTNAAVLVYDITRKDSFEEMQNYWANQIKECSPPGIILAVAANKSDLIDKEAVDEEEARKFAENLGAIYVSTTATKIEPINDLFIQIAKKYTGSNDIKIKEEEEEAQVEQNNDTNKKGVKLTKEGKNDKDDKQNRKRGFC